jgi:hypothetical protein
VKKYSYLFEITTFFNGETLPNQVITQPSGGMAESKIHSFESAPTR